MIFSTTSLLPPPPPPHHHRHNHRRFSLIAATTPSPSPSPSTTIIIGAGLSGLAAATHLHRRNLPFLLLDSSDTPGGRVRTDSSGPFLLDRGFHILLTSYPECTNLLDFPALNLRKFYSGAKIFHSGEFFTVSDPLRHPIDSIATLSNPIGTLTDKLLIAITRIRVLLLSDDVIFRSDEVTILDKLRQSGFSDSIIYRFFRPFFAGIFFDFNLETSSRLFDFVFKCLAIGDSALPERGIGEIPKQLAANLPVGSVRMNSRVSSIEEEVGGRSVTVRLESGEEIRTEVGVVLAVEEPEAARLLPSVLKDGVKKPGRSTVCLYFSMERDKVPTDKPMLYLNGSGEGIVNNMFFATNVVPSYGPPDKALVSVSLIGSYDEVSDEELAGRVVEELRGWFGESVVGSWEHLKTYRVKFAQPNQSPPTDLFKSPRTGSGLVYLCGDYLTNATFDGALVSGRRAVEALLEDRRLDKSSPKSMN